MEHTHQHSLNAASVAPVTGRSPYSSPLDLSPIETSAQTPDDLLAGKLERCSPFQAYIHNGWSGIRSNVFASLCRTGQPPARCRRFNDCCRRPLPEYSGDDEATATDWRIVAQRCHDRLCTPCAMARAMDLRLALHTHLAGRDHKFITLTLRTLPAEPLEKCIKRLYAGFKALRRMPVWAKNVKGGAAFLEITRGKQPPSPGGASCGRVETGEGPPALENGHWHAHLHIIADANYIEKFNLICAWKQATEDSFIVDIQAVTGNKATHYVTKYVTKALSGPVLAAPELLDEFVTAIKGTRLCITFGTWYGHAQLLPLEDENYDPEFLIARRYKPAHLHTVESILTFIPQTPAGLALSRLPFIRWMRAKARAT